MHRPPAEVGTTSRRMQPTNLVLAMYRSRFPRVLSKLRPSRCCSDSVMDVNRNCHSFPPGQFGVIRFPTPPR